MKNRIRDLRKEKGLSARELGEKFGLSESTILYYETEKRTPTPELLDNLATFFDCSVDYLLGRIDIREDLKNIYIEIAEDAVEGGISPEQLKSIIEVYKKAEEHYRNKK